MKKLILLLFIVVASAAVKAQEPVWQNNLDQAMELSNKSGKPMLLFFTGSDWCGWCKRLQAEVFTQSEFKKWATDNVILVEVDFPRMTPLSPEMQAQNNKLQQFFGVTGFPTIWFVNANKTADNINFIKLGSTGYLQGGAPNWVENAKKILLNK